MSSVDVCDRKWVCESGGVWGQTWVMVCAIAGHGAVGPLFFAGWGI
jgi:hypothetical protein